MFAWSGGSDDRSLRGVLALPAGTTLLHLADDRLVTLVTLVRDSSDVEIVEVRRIVRQENP